MILDPIPTLPFFMKWSFRCCFQRQEELENTDILQVPNKHQLKPSGAYVRTIPVSHYYCQWKGWPCLRLKIE